MDSVVGAKDAVVNLKDVIEVERAEALNADAKTFLKSILTGTGVLRSDASVDHQLLIKLSFREPIKLRAIKFFAVSASQADAVQSENEDGSTESGPKRVKLFVNNANLSFADADTEPAAEVLTLTPADLAADAEKPVKFVKFQNVSHLSLYIEENLQDTDVTVLNRVTLVGTAMTATKMSELKKIGDDH